MILRDGVLDADAMEAAAQLEKIVRIEVGSGSVDADACRRRGIDVEVVPSPSLMSVAEHAVTAILMLLKRIPQATDRLRAGGRSSAASSRALTTQEEYAYNWVGLGALRRALGPDDRPRRARTHRVGTRARLLRCSGADVAYTKRSAASP